MLKGLIRLVPYAIAILSLTPYAQADDARRVLTGTLGKTPIVVELDSQDQGEIYGRYFYRKYHRDLALSGTLKGDTLTLAEGNNRFGDEKPLPTLTLKSTNNGWQGEWKDPKGKTLPVQLTEAQLPAPASDTLPFIADLASSDPYEYLRLQELKLKAAKQGNFMGYTLQWWTEPESQLSLFTVESGYSKEEQKRINEHLLGRLWSEVINYHGCQLGAGEMAEFNQNTTPKFLSPEVVSLDIFTSYDCGGAHPDFGSSPVNLNVHTGEYLELQDVLWVGEPDEAASGIDQRESLAPWLVKQFAALYPDEMQKPTDENECDYTDESVWGYSNWHFTPKGLYLGAYFARFQRSCDDPEWSVLPYSVVKQYPGALKLNLP